MKPGLYSIYNKKQRRIIRCFNSYEDAQKYLKSAPESSEIIQTDKMFEMIYEKYHLEFK